MGIPVELRRLAPDLAKAGQEVYDDWVQDAEGYSEEYATGGICDAVADAMVEVLNRHGIGDAITFHYEQMNHTVVICRVEGDTFEVDIPWGFYESGGWYNYQKIPGVRFNADMVTIQKADEDFDNYAEEW